MAARWMIPIPLLASLVLALPAGANPMPAIPLWYATPPLAPPATPIALTLFNASADTIWLHNSGPWQIEDAAGDTVRTAGLVLQAIFPIPPGGTWSWPWDQKDDNGAQVAAGQYTAILVWHDENWNAHEEVAPIHILGGVIWKVAPNPAAAGTQLVLTLTNATTEQIKLDNSAPWWITDRNDVEVYRPLNNPQIQTLAAGQSRSWIWDLNVTGGQPCPAGDYVAGITYRNADRTVRMEAEDLFAITPVPAGQVLWEVSPRVNSTKSSVAMTLTNATPDTIWISNSAPWAVYDAGGQYVDSDAALQALFPIPPGGSLGWCWDERYWGGKFVPPGPYEARIGYRHSLQGQPVPLSRGFTLVDPGCQFVRSDHSFYWPEEIIQFTFTNCMPDSVAMPCTQAWWITTAWGQPVYFPLVLWAWTFWPSGSGFDFSWDQHMYNGQLAPPGQYLAWVYFTDKHGLTRYLACSPPVTIYPAAGVEDPPIAPDARMAIVPNPPEAESVVRFQLFGGPAEVAMRVVDVSGRVVIERDLGWMAPGPHEIPWPDRDARGRPLASGTYFCVIRGGARSFVEKAVIVE